jgi:hypothetical protein
VLKNFKNGLILGISLLTLSGCGNTTIQTIANKGHDAVNEVNRVSSAFNNAATALDSKVQAVKKSPVYDNKFTFGELFNATLQNTKWESDKDKNEVQITGQLKEFLFAPVFKDDPGSQKLLDKYLVDKTTTYTIIFPFYKDSPTVDMDIFSEVNANINTKGGKFEVNGQELVSILAEAFITKQKTN